AVATTLANCSLIFVPPAGAVDSAMEAASAGIPLVVLITEGIPTMDMVRCKKFLADCGTTLIGPNCPGIISPGAAKIGIMPGYIHKGGNVGGISRSEPLTYEPVCQLTSRGYGQSTCIRIGDDQINGRSHVSAVKILE